MKNIQSQDQMFQWFRIHYRYLHCSCVTFWAQVLVFIHSVPISRMINAWLEISVMSVLKLSVSEKFQGISNLLCSLLSSAESFATNLTKLGHSAQVEQGGCLDQEGDRDIRLLEIKLMLKQTQDAPCIDSSFCIVLVSPVRNEAKETN